MHTIINTLCNYLTATKKQARERKAQPLPHGPSLTQKQASTKSLTGTRHHQSQIGHGVEWHIEGGQMLHAALHWWNQAVLCYQEQLLHQLLGGQGVLLLGCEVSVLMSLMT